MSFVAHWTPLTLRDISCFHRGVVVAVALLYFTRPILVLVYRRCWDAFTL